MSLKSFHIIFIVISTLLTLGLGAWGVLEYRASQKLFFLAYSAGAAIAVALLAFYLQAFLHKIRSLQSS